MSRAFVKEQDVDYLEMPERPVSEHPNDVTEAGLAQIEDALAKASEAYAIAQASADRAALAAAGRELRYWSARRASARIVATPADTSEVRFGASVTIRRDAGADVPDRRRGRSRPRQRFDLSRLAACEINVRKARRRHGHGRQRASRNRSDQLWRCRRREQATHQLRRRRS